MPQKSDYEKNLNGWGIKFETALHFSLQKNGRGGYVYPSQPEAPAEYRHRVLLADPSVTGSKNFWDPHTKHLPMPALFNLPALRLPSSKELVYLTNGEKATMALHTAGILNAINTFGEGNRVEAAAKAIIENENQALYLAPDCDRAGLMAAQKWQHYAQEYGIELDLRDLRLYLVRQFELTPQECKGYDLRDLWLLKKQNAKDFQEALVNLPPLEFERYRDELPNPQPAPQRYSPPPQRREEKRPTQNSTHIDWEAEYNNWRGLVTATLDRASPPPQSGYHRHCPNPHHEDKHPSFRITPEGAPICSCTSNISWKTLAEWLDVLPWEEYKTQRLAEYKAEKKKKAAAGKDYIQNYIDPYELTSFTADIKVNLPYISDIDLQLIPEKSNVIIKSPLGTGKTELIQRLIAHREAQLGRKPHVLILTHRQALATLTAARLGIACYQRMEKSELAAATQLAICYNSLKRLAQVGKALHRYDLVVVDEFEQFQQHLGGSTFRQGEALRAYSIFRELARTATSFVALDADASQMSINWMRETIGNVIAIHNTYRPTRSTLTIHRNQETVVAQALKFTKEDGVDPILIPVSTRNDAKTFEKYFKDKLGDDAVMMICSDNSEGRVQRHFVNNINTELPKYKILIYTSSLGTGIDITTPVRAVCGVFFGTHMPATEFKQMIGRARNTQEVHAYVQPVQYGNHLTDPQEIYERHINRANITALECAFDEHNIWSVTPLQAEVLRMLCAQEAETNRSKNDILSHFVALMQDEGYTLDCHDTRSQRTKQALKDAGEAIRQDEKEAVLDADPVSHVKLNDIRAEGGDITPQINAGHKRFKIEDSVGLDITEDIYDDLHDRRDRAKLRFFTSLFFDDKVLRDADRQEAINEHLLSHRKHYTRRKQLVLELLHSVWGIERLVDLLDHCDNRLREEEINELTESFISANYEHLYLYFHWRDHYSPKPIQMLRRILGELGLKLESHRRRVDGQRIREYTVDKSSLQIMIEYAENRKKHVLKKLRDKAPPSQVSQNRHIDMLSTCPGTDDFALDTQNKAVNLVNSALEMDLSSKQRTYSGDLPPEVSQNRHIDILSACSGTDDMLFSLYPEVFLGECMEALDGDIGQSVREYLLEQGVTRQMIDAQQLGYNPKSQRFYREEEFLWLPPGIVRPIFREKRLVGISVSPMSHGLRFTNILIYP